MKADITKERLAYDTQIMKEEVEENKIDKCYCNFCKMKQNNTIGPSEVRVLPVRRCRRAAWQT